MSEKNDGGPAFPSGDGPFGGGPCHYPGMTLRDWFAGQALAGFCADPNIAAGPKALAGYAYEQADAMLATRTPAVVPEKEITNGQDG